MRRWGVVVAVLAISAPAVAGLEEAAIRPPAGWTETDARQARGAILSQLPDARHGDGRLWVEPDGASELAIVEAVVGGGHSGRAAIRALDAGLRSTSFGEELAYAVEERGAQTHVRHTIVEGGQLVHAHRIYAVDGHGAVHVAIARCTGTPPGPLPCEAALGTLRLGVIDRGPPADAAPVRADEDAPAAAGAPPARGPSAAPPPRARKREGVDFGRAAKFGLLVAAAFALVGYLIRGRRG